MSQKTRVAIIGCGKLGGIIASGLVRSGWQRGEVIVSDLTKEAAVGAAVKLGVTSASSNAEAAKNSLVLVIAVKPKDVRGALEQIESEITGGHLVISVAAGKTTGWIEDRLPDETPVIRAMPNVAASVGLSITALAPGTAASRDHLKQATEVFEAIGETLVVDETVMDAITAVSGSGPAYFAFIAEAMIEAALQLGLDEELASRLVVATLSGTSEMVRKGGWKASELRKAVTSPGGTTEAALAQLEAAGVKEAFSTAISAAAARAKQLSEG